MTLARSRAPARSACPETPSSTAPPSTTGHPGQHWPSDADGTGPQAVERTPSGWRVGDEELPDLTSAMVLADILNAELTARGAGRTGRVHGQRCTPARRPPRDAAERNSGLIAGAHAPAPATAPSSAGHPAAGPAAAARTGPARAAGPRNWPRRNSSRRPWPSSSAR